MEWKILKEFFYPNRNKIILFIIFAVFFWFFPIVSNNIISSPLRYFYSPIFSFIINLLAAYIFSCFIIESSDNKKILLLVIFIIITVYLMIPKISSDYHGDLGGTTQTYCNCFGFDWTDTKCCWTSVDYCIGICLKNETVSHWYWETGI